MIQAIRDDNPVMYFFHKGIMGLPWMGYFKGSTNMVPEDPYTVPFGKANIVREGSDLTLVTLSQMVQKSLIAANNLSKEGISVEVIDLRTLVPLDRDTVLESLKKTGRLCIADEDYTRLDSFSFWFHRDAAVKPKRKGIPKWIISAVVSVPCNEQPSRSKGSGNIKKR